MPLSTASAAVFITPTVFKTIYKHYSAKAAKLKNGSEEDVATDDILFDEAFHIVKSFIELTTYNTVESIQSFTNTHIPDLPWASVSPVNIPLSSCNQAADHLIEWFGTEELKIVVGGERWWQVRGMDGVDAEWVTEKKYLNHVDISKISQRRADERGSSLSEEEVDILKMEKLDTVMLYVHGGAYFWGSINTHRYQTIRYARKMKGKVFAVNYRKAPQYPWPCALQDVLAAYMYLIHPPPEALHSPIPHTKIVLAGDSAGAGLCITVLTIIRDLDLPMPAGAVLISPWVDLTHSFPSVMQNTATDIIPPHGFINKPSTVWPIVSAPDENTRVIESDTPPPPKPGHADTLKPDRNRMSATAFVPKKVAEKEGGDTGENDKAKYKMSYEDKASDRRNLSANEDDSQGAEEKKHAPTLASSHIHGSEESWEPKPPKVLMEDPTATPLELRSQIQHYATNEQLTHPLVSPILQGSLGNLCPLYIIAGDGEALRDEIIYLAHRAADPEHYPVRRESLASRRQEENSEKYQKPTNVRLQVYDGMCHVLTVFTFTPSAKYAYNTIAKFVQRVTGHADGADYEYEGFPNVDRSQSLSHQGSSADSLDSWQKRDREEAAFLSKSRGLGSLPSPEPFDSGDLSQSASPDHMINNRARETSSSDSVSPQNKCTNSNMIPDQEEDSEPYKLNVTMLRERIDVNGHVRDMEPAEKIDILQLPAKEIGLLKEAPARRWLTGQETWDKKFKSSAKKVIKARRKNEVKYEKLLSRANELGLVLHPEGNDPQRHANNSRDSSPQHSDMAKKIQDDRRWGPLDLDKEKPPPSAIAKRKDTPDAVALLKKTIYYTAPVTTKVVPQRKAVDGIKAAFDPSDDPRGPPRQSVSEQQSKAELLPHGLRIWTYLMTYFARKSSNQVIKGKDRAASAIQETWDKLPGALNSSSQEQDGQIPTASSSAELDKR